MPYCLLLLSLQEPKPKPTASIRSKAVSMPIKDLTPCGVSTGFSIVRDGVVVGAMGGGGRFFCI